MREKRTRMSTDHGIQDHRESSPPTAGPSSSSHSWWGWLCVCIPVFMILGGCTARPTQMTPVETDALQAAYRAGLQTALRGYQEQMLDNDFPYTNWSPPLVQRLWVPARITGGVFIPGHMEEVIVKPGAWKREFSAPLSTHQPMSQTRPYTRERPVGSADRPRSAAAAEDSVPSPSRVPAVPRSRTARTASTGAGWAELPAPGDQWGATP